MKISALILATVSAVVIFFTGVSILQACGKNDQTKLPVIEYPDQPETPELPEGDIRPAEPFKGVRPRNTLITDDVIARGRRLDTGNETWRKQADARIERDRKGDLVVQVVDSEGNPVENATVKVEMTNHEFGFGGALNPADMTPAKKQQYLDMCNSAVFGNNMKWKHDAANVKVTEPVLDWLVDSGIKVRGHSIFWMTWKNLPDGFQQKYSNNIPGLREEMEKRCNYWVPYWGDRLIEWDVFNEPYAEPVKEVIDQLGWDVVDYFLRRVKELQPGMKNYINDFGLLNDNQAKQEKFRQMILDLQAKGSPIDGIGMQLYPRGKLNVETVVNNLQRWAQLGLELRLTEYAYIQAPTQPSVEIKARDTFDVITACFSVKACKGFIWWGPFGGNIFTENGLSDVGAGVAYLLFEKWWTNVSGQTSNEGVYETRAFYGDYKISVKAGDKEKVTTISFRSDSKHELMVTI